MAEARDMLKEDTRIGSPLFLKLFLCDPTRYRPQTLYPSLFPPQQLATGGGDITLALIVFGT